MPNKAKNQLQDLSIAYKMTKTELSLFKHQVDKVSALHVSNPKQHPLTPDKLRTFKGYEDISDEEAHDLIRQFDYVSRIFVAFHDKFTKLCA